ncbi:hypothetical protein R3P38DRAFT_2900274 [Favolaschia claudopus]|uniref:Arrestin-like N-terminal domain-containing protein n=1 Tax=Favolaschia claudopus TaxID=2862362 RepID=A0AAW0CK77_9AGAR
MYTTRPPAYSTRRLPSFNRAPSYSAEPRQDEQRLALGASPRAHNFRKASKNGEIVLRLAQQNADVVLPVYGLGDIVNGRIHLTRTDNVSVVELQIEGHLKLKEGGETHHKLCLDKVILWRKNARNPVCPSFLRFARRLPTSFEFGGKNYPLPPSHSVKLKGLPGFSATIEYSVSAITRVGNTTVSTPFVYYPRSRSAAPVPPPLLSTEAGQFIPQPDWTTYPSVLKMKTKDGLRDVNIKLHLPSSRVFCVSEGVPFHISFESDERTLTAFTPYGPSTTESGESRKPSAPATRIRVMRRTTADARNTAADGVQGGIWRADYIGQAKFTPVCTSPRCKSFTGTIEIEPITAMGFHVPGLSVQDCILLTVAPAEGTRTPPFAGIREAVPIRLTTDPWDEDELEEGIEVARRSMSASPSRAAL